MGDVLAQTIGIGEQIKVVERELRYRARVYPKLIDRGSMTPQDADLNMRQMNAVLKTLKTLQVVG